MQPINDIHLLITEANCIIYNSGFCICILNMFLITFYQRTITTFQSVSLHYLSQLPQDNLRSSHLHNSLREFLFQLQRHI